MNQDSLQSALIALSKRSQVSQQLLSTHLQQAQDRLSDAQKQLEDVEARVERLFNVLNRTLDGTGPCIVLAQALPEKLDLLEQALERGIL